MHSQQATGDTVEARLGLFDRHLQWLGQQRRQLRSAGGRQLAATFGKTENGALFVKAEREGRWQRFGVGEQRFAQRRIAIDHQGAGGDIAEALERRVVQATDNAQGIAERQDIDEAQQVARQ